MQFSPDMTHPFPWVPSHTRTHTYRCSFQSLQERQQLLKREHIPISIQPCPLALGLHVSVSTSASSQMKSYFSAPEYKRIHQKQCRTYRKLHWQQETVFFRKKPFFFLPLKDLRSVTEKQVSLVTSVFPKGRIKM